MSFTIMVDMDLQRVVDVVVEEEILTLMEVKVRQAKVTTAEMDILTAPILSRTVQLVVAVEEEQEVLHELLSPKVEMASPLT
mmetsp:Transcript_10770/g.14826  ORF Transcript_10770/g.14826 Transcript_10770/m.14826 type:complete len:82 (+) Transcript_10770:57-302(+)